ncbi:hypothetical protein KQI65_10525 [bacterium]|nr:hypothetical protein [bacterium]
MHNYRSPILIIALSVLLLQFTACDDTPSSPPDTTNDADTAVVYDAADTLCVLSDERILELSGIAASRRSDGIYWLHNDSGDEARLFAVDSAGNTLAVCLLSGASHVDWEDIASVQRNDTAWLYVGDIGDNAANRSDVRVIRLVEPAVEPQWRNREISAAFSEAVFTYEDGPRDSEALMVDSRDGAVLLVEKTTGFEAGVYRADWPGSGGSGLCLRHAVVSLPFSLGFLRQVTAADYRPDHGAMLLRCYGGVIEQYGPSASTLRELLAADSSVTLTYPPLPQSEAVCYSRNSRAVLTGSEGNHMPLLIRRRR